MIVRVIHPEKTVDFELSIEKYNELVSLWHFKRSNAFEFCEKYGKPLEVYKRNYENEGMRRWANECYCNFYAITNELGEIK